MLQICHNYISQQNQSIFLRKHLSKLPQAIVEAGLLLRIERTLLKFNALFSADMKRMFECCFILGVNFKKILDGLYFLLSSLAQKLHINIIIMQHPTLTLIIRYPNDTLHLASQDHLKNKVIIKCVSCGQIEVVLKNTKESTCKNCGYQSKVQTVKGQNCRKQNCNGELKLMMMATGMMVEECSVCDYRQIVNLR